MANPGQPTISLGATGEAVKRLERALRRTPDLGLTVDGVFGPQVETAGPAAWCLSHALYSALGTRSRT